MPLSRRAMKMLCLAAAAMLAARAEGCAAQGQALEAEDVGVAHIEAVSPQRGVDLDVTVWYPAAPGGAATVLGESPFFVGTAAMLGAPIADGTFPLVLLSHGAGMAGNAQALSWIAAPLAKRGFIVAAPDHPGNGGINRSAKETLKLWLRPGDISDSLTAVEKDEFFGRHLDEGKVGVLGLSAGGGTALALAGARIDPVRLSAYCDTDALNPSLCGWLRESGVDLHAMDMRSADRDNEDRRIRFAMAIDPAPVDVFQPASFSRISIPVDIVNLGLPDTIPLTARARDVARAIVASRYSVIEDASHFSMFAVCKPGAAEKAEAAKVGDPICTDGGGRPRSELHAQLIDLVVAAFERELVSVPRTTGQ